MNYYVYETDIMKDVCRISNEFLKRFPPDVLYVPLSKFVYAIQCNRNDRNNDRCRLRSVSLNKTKERHHIHTSKSRS